MIFSNNFQKILIIYRLFSLKKLLKISNYMGKPNIHDMKIDKINKCIKSYFVIRTHELCIRNKINFYYANIYKMKSKCNMVRMYK